MDPPKSEKTLSPFVLGKTAQGRDMVVYRSQSNPGFVYEFCCSNVRNQTSFWTCKGCRNVRNSFTGPGDPPPAPVIRVVGTTFATDPDFPLSKHVCKPIPFAESIARQVKEYLKLDIQMSLTKPRVAFNRAMESLSGQWTLDEELRKDVEKRVKYRSLHSSLYRILKKAKNGTAKQENGAAIMGFDPKGVDQWSAEDAENSLVPAREHAFAHDSHMADISSQSHESSDLHIAQNGSTNCSNDENLALRDTETLVQLQLPEDAAEVKSNFTTIKGTENGVTCERGDSNDSPGELPVQPEHPPLSSLFPPNPGCYNGPIPGPTGTSIPWFVPPPLLHHMIARDPVMKGERRAATSAPPSSENTFQNEFEDGLNENNGPSRKSRKRRLSGSQSPPDSGDSNRERKRDSEANRDLIRLRIEHEREQHAALMRLYGEQLEAARAQKEYFQKLMGNG